MKHILYILSFTLVFTQSLEVDGDLHVTGDIQAAKIDSLEAVIAQLQSNANTTNVLFMVGASNEPSGWELLYFLLIDGSFWEYQNIGGNWLELLSVPFDANEVVHMSCAANDEFVNNFPGGKDVVFCFLKNTLPFFFMRSDKNEKTFQRKLVSKTLMEWIFLSSRIIFS